MAFRQEYKALEQEFKRQVGKDNAKFSIKSDFLPNIPPEGPVDFILVGSEPSTKALYGWNFASAFQDFLLHYCIREYLCQGGKTYHLTDLSKGAMKTQIAPRKRRERYEKWYPLLQDELRLVAKSGAQIIPIGGKVNEFLISQEKRGRPLERPVEERIPHHSLQAANSFGKSIAGREATYRQFCSEVKLSHIEQATKEVLTQIGIDKPRIEARLKAFRHGAGLTERRKKLMFDYKVAFARINGVEV